MTYLPITVSSGASYPHAWRKWSFLRLRPTLMSLISFGFSTLLDPSCNTPSPTSNSTSPNFCFPVGRDFRLLFSNRFECRFSSHFTFVCPLRLTNLTGSDLPTGAATTAAARRPAARHETVRTTTDLRGGNGRPTVSIAETPPGGKRSLGCYNPRHDPSALN